MNNRRKFIFGSSSFFLLGFCQNSYSSFNVLAVRIWPAKDYTRIAIEHKQINLKINTFILKNPERLVLDIKNNSLLDSFQSIVSNLQFQDEYLSKIRVGQFDKNTLRIVFELKQTIKPKVFSLEPIAHYQNRLVVDLYPTKPIDPLLALIQKYEPQSDTPEDLTKKPNFGFQQQNNLTIALDPGHGG